MDASEVVDLVRAVIWPAVITGLAIFFRRQVRDLLKRITTIKAGAWEAHLQQQVDDATSDVQALGAAQATEEPRELARPEQHEHPLREHFRKVRSLADATPEGAMDLAWRTVSSVLEGALPAWDGQEASSSEPSLIKQVGQAGLEAQQVRALRSLRRTRNEALNGPESVSTDIAEEYVDAAEAMAFLLLDFRRQHEG